MFNGVSQTFFWRRQRQYNEVRLCRSVLTALLLNKPQIKLKRYIICVSSRGNYIYASMWYQMKLNSDVDLQSRDGGKVGNSVTCCQ